ncbi:MAG: precorrin-2 C(20)-methyltransferase [Nitrospirota bacterium]
MIGKVYGVGVGPGDPELLTVKALRLIREAKVICSPRAGDDSESFALSIVKDYIDPARQKIMTPVFPMSMDKEVLGKAWDGAADQVLAELEKGNDLVFLTLGDPSLYSTYSYILERIKKRIKDIRSETVSGVSSINLAAARAGIDLALGQERLAVMPMGRDLEPVRSALADFDTVVLMKVNRGFGKLVSLLGEMGLLGKAVYVSRCGTDREKIIRDLQAIKADELDYFSIVIVRKWIAAG